MDEIIIGQGQNATTTITVFGIEDEGHGVSENALFYRVSLEVIEVRLRIYKDHPVGLKLTAMIDKGKGWKEMESYLTGVALKKVPAEHVFNLIRQAKAQAYRRGMSDKAKEIRKVLMHDENSYFETDPWS